MYTIEIVWNREFNWCFWESETNLKEAKKIAIDIVNSGDSARVKKARILDKNGKQIFQC